MSRRLTKSQQEKAIELLEEILEYVEMVEEQIDGEWGHCRKFDKLLEDGDVTTHYTEIKELLKEVDNV